MNTEKSNRSVASFKFGEEHWPMFTVDFTYNTNAMEGSGATHREVESLLRTGIWPDRPRSEVTEAIGVSQAVCLLRHTKAHVSIGLIRELHWTVFRDSKGFAGNLREPGHEVAVGDQHGNAIHFGANSVMVPKLLDGLVDTYAANKGTCDPLVLAAKIHNEFEGIHPFSDGNGRVGRLLLLNMLIKNGLPPVDIRLESRHEYYDALQRYDRYHNIQPTVELIEKEYAVMREKFGL